MPVSPPRPKGPPLNALRTFEAAARLGSFALAAEELSVTPGAVSQHVKVLEGWAGMPLFRRRAQGVALTAEGQRLLPGLSSGFDSLYRAARLLRELGEPDAVGIAALPSVAQLWLQPRLGQIRRTMPGIAISVHALETPPDLGRNLFDLSLFIRDPEPGDRAVALAEDRIFPVCAPGIAAQLQSGSNLDGVVLLVDETWESDWAAWTRTAGITLPERPPEQRYSLYSMALADARDGAGVIMGHESLVAADLASGALVRPFTAVCDTGKALVLELPPAPTAAARELAKLLKSAS